MAVGDNIILSFSEGRNDEIAVLGKVNTVISSTEGVITGVTAGTNLNGGGSAGSVTLNLDSSITLTTVNADLVGSQSGGSVSATTLTASGDANFDSGTLFVDVSANRVGIGTTSPTYDLDIENATAAIVSLNDSGGTAGGSTNAHFIFESGGSDAGKLGFINSGDATMKLQNFDGVLTLETLTDDSVSIRTNNSSRMLLNSSGVTIGAGSNAVLPIDFQAPSTSVGARMRFEDSASGTTSGMLFTAYGQSVDYNSQPFIGKTDVTNSGPVGIWHSGEWRMAVTNAGKVGVGTLTPVAGVDIATTGGDTWTTNGWDSGLILNAASAVRWRTASGYDWGMGNSGTKLYFMSSTSPTTGAAADYHMVIAGDTGNVGINTTSANHMLEVGGNAAFNSTSQILDNWSSGSDIDALLPGSGFGGVLKTNTSGHFVIGLRNNDTADSFSIVSGGCSYTSNSTFDTLVANFSSDGDVGIGTTSPNAKLHVAGDFYVPGNVVAMYSFRDTGGQRTISTNTLVINQSVTTQGIPNSSSCGSPLSSSSRLLQRTRMSGSWLTAPISPLVIGQWKRTILGTALITSVSRLCRWAIRER